MMREVIVIHNMTCQLSYSLNIRQQHKQNKSCHQWQHKKPPDGTLSQQSIRRHLSYVFLLMPRGCFYIFLLKVQKVERGLFVQLLFSQPAMTPSLQCPRGNDELSWAVLTGRHAVDEI